MRDLIDTPNIQAVLTLQTNTKEQFFWGYASSKKISKKSSFLVFKTQIFNLDLV